MGSSEVDGLDSFDSRKYDPGPVRELMRGVIAGILVGMLAFIVVGIFVIALWGIGGKGNLDLLQVVATTLLTPIVGLVGAVTGFYYGEKSAETRN